MARVMNPPVKRRADHGRRPVTFQDLYLLLDDEDVILCFRAKVHSFLFAGLCQGNRTWSGRDE